MSTVYPLKFILLGDSSTGKTQLSRRFTNKDFRVDSTATVGLEFATREIPFERCVIKAQIWDTAGQERFESMTKVYYRDALGALLVYDATNRTSFENLKNVWLKQLKEYGHESIGMVLVGNKVDKDESEFKSQRAVSTEEAASFAEAEGMDFVETSALTCSKVEVAFRRLVLSVASSMPDIKIHLEVTGLPSGWIKHMQSLPIPPTGSAPSSAPPSAACSPQSTGLSMLPLPEGVASSSSSNSGEGGSGGSSPTGTGGDEVKSDESASAVSRAKATSRSNSIINAEGALYVNYWTGSVVAELPTEPASTEMLHLTTKVRGTRSIHEKRSDLSITSPPPTKVAGRCFCAVL